MIEIGLSLASESNTWIVLVETINLPRETNLALTNDSDEERLEHLILGMREFSTTKRGSTGQGQVPLFITTTETSISPIEEGDELNEENSDIETYIDSITDSHDYEFLSTHTCCTYSAFGAYENQSPLDDGITYEDIELDLVLITYVYDR